MEETAEARLAALRILIDYATNEAEEMELTELEDLLDAASALIGEILSRTACQVRKAQIRLVHNAAAPLKENAGRG